MKHRLKATLLALCATACDTGGGNDTTDPGTSTGSASAESTGSTSGPGPTSGSAEATGTDETGSADESGSGETGTGGDAPTEHEYTGNYALETVNAVSTDAYVGDIAIAVGEVDGDVHIAFSERPVNDEWILRYAYKAYGSGEFETTTISTSANEPVEAFTNADGTPCIVWVRRAVTSDLVVSCLDGTGDWQDEDLGNFNGALDDVRNLDLAIDLDGEPVLYYQHPGTGENTIARRSGDEWTQDIVENPDYIFSSAAAIAIDANNVPHVAMLGRVVAVPRMPAGVLYFATDGSAGAFGQNMGSGELDPYLDMALDDDNRPIIARGDGTLFHISQEEEDVLQRSELPQGATWLRVIYDEADDLTFRVYGNGNLGFDVRVGGGIPTDFPDPMTDGGGQFAAPVYVHGQLHIAHWKGGGVPPQMRYTLATPI